ncbi:MAG: GNAT family N-acetyltransferase [Thermoanaerobaculia bacterium]|nr:GNAT family N-acetyltransferase [Thermoanaerobaculia bacterium]
MSEPTTIRVATLHDSETLTLLAERTFRAAFADQNTTEDMDAYVQDAFSQEAIRRELEDDTSTFLLAFAADRNEPIGYAKLRAGAPVACVSGPDPIELQRIYADPTVLGRGVGAALVRAVMDTARSLGHRTLWLGVWERDARAISFYESWGLETVGNQVFQLGSDDQVDLVMQCSLAPGPCGTGQGNPGA